MFSTLLLLYLAFTTSTYAKCDCGFSVNSTSDASHQIFTEYVETEFTRNTIEGWRPQEYNVTQKEARGPYGKQASVDNVVTSSEGLELWVRPAVGDHMIPMAEVDTERVDMLYGSFRIRAKMGSVRGTCAAFFWFWNNTQEIDMEFLSRQFKNASDAPVNLVIQSRQSQAQGYNAQGTPGFDLHQLPFRPDQDFHEYRFDWIPGQVSFYADNRLLKIMTHEIPNAAGHVVLNHWSNGDVNWSAGPPASDTAMVVTHAHLYFNSSSPYAKDRHVKGCPHFDHAKVCQIKDDITQNLMLAPMPTLPTSNATATAIEEQKKKARAKGTVGFIIAGAIVGLLIVLFIAAMVTIRHWRNCCSGSRRRNEVVSGKNESTDSSMEMREKMIR